MNHAAFLMVLTSCYLFKQGEWLCLNCQTQRALSGSLGDIEQIPRPLATSGTESAALPKDQTIKISDKVQATENPDPVPKPTTEEQKVPSNVQPVESISAPSASILTTDDTPIRAADKSDVLKFVPPETTVRKEKLSTEIVLQHVSSQEVETLQIESETTPTEAVITTLSEIVQSTVKPNNETTQAIDSLNEMKPSTVEVSFEFEESCKLTSMVMYLNVFLVNIFLPNPFIFI